MERDNQRSKLYKAENEALAEFQTELATVPDIEKYLKRQSQRATLQKRYGFAINVTEWKLTVADGRGTVNALAYGTYKISIPLWARNDRVVLHEWAHVVHERLTYPKCGHAALRRQELKGGAAHGWQFAAIYLDLVRFCMGSDAADALKASFKKHRVRYRPKKTREMTPEMIANLANARAAAKARN